MTKVVCNASPIIGLAMLGLLNLLHEVFEVYIARGAYNEILLAREDDAIGKKEFNNIDEEFIMKLSRVATEFIVCYPFGVSEGFDKVRLD